MHARPDADPRRPPAALPEYRLLRATLALALADLTDARHTPDREAWRASAVAWINGAGAPIPFADCCAWLGLNPGRVRAAPLDPNRLPVALFTIGEALTAA